PPAVHLLLRSVSQIPAETTRGAAILRMTAPRFDDAVLLEGDLRASSLELLLRLLGGFLADLLQNRLRRALHQLLGLLQAQAGQRPDLLDDLDLLVTSGLEDDVELVLLLGRGGLASATATRHRGDSGDRGRRGDLEGLLELLHELGELEQRHLLERLEQLFSGQLRHGVFLSSSRGPAAVCLRPMWTVAG